MFIEVVRSGGIAGSIRRARVDLDAIVDEASAREWRGLVEQARPLILSQSLIVLQDQGASTEPAWVRADT